MRIHVDEYVFNYKKWKLTAKVHCLKHVGITTGENLARFAGDEGSHSRGGRNVRNTFHHFFENKTGRFWNGQASLEPIRLVQRREQCVSGSLLIPLTKDLLRDHLRIEAIEYCIPCQDEFAAVARLLPEREHDLRAALRPTLAALR